MSNYKKKRISESLCKIFAKTANYKNAQISIFVILLRYLLDSVLPKITIICVYFPSEDECLKKKCQQI